MASFQANIMPPDQPEAAMETGDSPLPQPSDVQIRCSGWVTIISCRHMTSAPHSWRYCPSIPRLCSSRSPRTFPEMHFMMSRPMHPPYVRPPFCCYPLKSASIFFLKLFCTLFPEFSMCSLCSRYVFYFLSARCA